MIVTQAKYNDAVKQCKQLMQARQNLKYEIAKISFTVCESQWGGKVRLGTYTVEKFAADVGIGYKSMQRWRREYDLVVSKIGLKTTQDLKRKALEETLKKVGRHTPEKEVRKIYDDFTKRTDNREDAYFLDVQKRIGNLKFAICHRLVLKSCDQGELRKVHEMVKEMDTQLKEHFAGAPTKSASNIRAMKKVGRLLEFGAV